MAYVDPDADKFVEDFPEFEDTDPDVITRTIAVAKRMVDTSWTEGDYTRAIELYTAHLLTRSAMAGETGGQAVGGAGGTGIASESLGPLSVSYQKSAASAQDAKNDPLMLQTTIYGQEFGMLLLINRGGARVTHGHGRL